MFIIVNDDKLEEIIKDYISKDSHCESKTAITTAPAIITAKYDIIELDEWVFFSHILLALRDRQTNEIRTARKVILLNRGFFIPDDPAHKQKSLLIGIKKGTMFFIADFPKKFEPDDMYSVNFIEGESKCYWYSEVL